MSAKIKLFLSYLPTDEELIESFITHISPWETKGDIAIWHEGKISGGENISKITEAELSEADIVCLFISSAFLASQTCIIQMEKVFALKKKKGLKVIPIILNRCLWDEVDELKNLKVIPSNISKPTIASYFDKNEAWQDIIASIKKVYSEIFLIKNLRLNSDFERFLSSTEMLSKSHSQKEELFLKDIFVYPYLTQFDKLDAIRNNKYHSKLFQKDIISFGKVLIVGDVQSGKTSLCKVLFHFLRELNYVPVYLNIDNTFQGDPNSKIQQAFNSQYDSQDFLQIDRSTIVPITDNFHLIKDAANYIRLIQDFKNQIIVVDEIFNLSLKNESLIKEYNQFKVLEFSPKLRNELISNWIKATESESISVNSNFLYQSIDTKTEIIENLLGKVIGKGIMPAYPFFILSILAAQDTNKPLDQEITSQGYCYQALIYLFLRKQGVKNEHIDIYTNYLTELAFYIFKDGITEFSNEDLKTFNQYYISKFNLPININDLIKTLTKVNICSFDSLSNFNFSYKYIYYFFVAKKLAENIESNKKTIDNILNNLHKDEYAYITIFISHHSKSNYLLDELLLNAEMLFEKYEPTTLNSTDLLFFDKHENKIIKAALPVGIKSTAHEKRQTMLEQKEELEIESADINTEISDNENENINYISLRKSIKTVEVMGQIIKNRSGSLELQRLEYIFEQGMKVHLRFLSFFFELIKNEEIESFFVEYIQDRLDKIIEEKDNNIKKEKIEKIAREIFWNINFGLVYGVVTKIIHSIGSTTLLNISSNVCDRENTPASFIINQGIQMWYAKNLKTEVIYNRMEKNGFSKTAKKLITHKIVEHISLHTIGIDEVKKIGNKFNLQSKSLLKIRKK